VRAGPRVTACVAGASLLADRPERDICVGCVALDRDRLDRDRRTVRLVDQLVLDPVRSAELASQLGREVGIGALVVPIVDCLPVLSDYLRYRRLVIGGGALMLLCGRPYSSRSRRWGDGPWLGSSDDLKQAHVVSPVERHSRQGGGRTRQSGVGFLRAVGEVDDSRGERSRESCWVTREPFDRLRVSHLRGERAGEEALHRCVCSTAVRTVPAAVSIATKADLVLETSATRRVRLRCAGISFLVILRATAEASGLSAVGAGDVFAPAWPLLEWLRTTSAAVAAAPSATAAAATPMYQEFRWMRRRPFPA